MSRVLKLLGVVALAVGTAMTVFVVGMRRKSPPVVDAVRRMNRAVTNPRQMRTAGTPGSYAAVIHHVGRSSGRAYETPVVPFATDEGFVIALPYGTRPDWLKNVLAAGSATLVHEGDTYEVYQPVVVPMAEAAPFLPPKEVRNLRLFGVDQCLRVHRVEAAPPM